MTKNFFFLETKYPETTSQSFPVSYFGFAVLYPTGGELSRFWCIKTQLRNIAIK